MSMSHFLFYNPNPRHKRSVGDCTVRALSKALNISWETAYIDLVSEGYDLGDMPSSNAVFDSYLRSKGFKKYTISNDCPSCYTFDDFAGEHFKGIYILCTGTHVACCENGFIRDSWDSSDETPIFYYEREDWR